ncbi:glycerophosphoryl diester phosphodiesterase membrane domain-containing protein [Streptomyces chiangmaiensis]|uniref:Glycerophosphoryl diester phosphodiesterase membrane domain-containing protein n=1 Tax=Streptomyces chiangmaiensis TaxID=766497 RepID=A0ABU7FL21_9ACTN|nr:glycerophosphoryl diester phosphodiesterase membrane domain-containing protein [Streptomyces chiangmaiensis]MED7824671.1 glycerophosphoryl diester phosphodiesterase membrane domain-containing protein [Streptomyces chiangmaiensis]
MEDTPGWASPGSAPSDGRQPDASGAQPPKQPSDQSGADQPHPPNWSKEQPPPAQWTAPQPQGPGQAAPPPPPPGPGWGGYPPATPGGYGGQGAGHGGSGGPGPDRGFGGYGAWGGTWGPPPAAKPGVIPLRPLGVGEILDGAVSTMRTHWRTVLGISLTVAVLTETLVILLQKLVLNDSATTETLNNPNASFREVSRTLGSVVLSSAVVSLIALLGTIVATALLTTVTSRAVLGRPVTTAEAWRDARPQLLRLLGLTLLLPLIAVGIITAGALPGIIVAVAGSVSAGVALAVLGGVAGGVVAVWIVMRFSLASPALMLEKQSIRKAMSRSVKLVRGSWWRVTGIQVLAQIIASIVASLVVVPFAFLAGALGGDGIGGFFNGTADSVGWTFLIVGGIGSVIGRMLTFPISAGVTVLLYIDQRIRREALDLELARAAGVPEHGPATPGATPGS